MSIPNFVLSDVCRQEYLEELFRGDIDDYVNDRIFESAYCPHGIPRKMVVYTPSQIRGVVYRPAVCDCPKTRIASGCKVATCRVSEGCPVRLLLFSKGVS